MKGTIIVELTDRPGQLAKIILPLAESGCNILNVHHTRETKREGVANVEITFQTDNKENVDRVVNNLKKEGVVILSYSPDLRTYRETVILIGHVFTTDITDTLIQIMKHDVQVASVDARITYMEEVSSVKMVLQSNSEEKLRSVIDLLKEICKKKNLFLVRGVSE
ncbi:MAG: ACT domain-containing protein [Candidatus Odinarchaeia archaeon]